jgi:hypothetical protein
MAKILFDKRVLWLLFIIIATAIFLSYVWSSWQVGHGNLLMPLDDVYIHFQYARQMALGHPYQYNLSDPPTSGATSFIYPYLLAFGYLIGFQGLWLGLWAMLLGAIALIASMWAVYRLCLFFELPQWLSLTMTLAFALTGSIAWHFMSGMETGIMIALSLWTLLFVLEKRLNVFVIAVVLLSMTRPEGGAMAGLASATMFLRLWNDYAPVDKNRGKRWKLVILLLPILAIGVQPLVNLLMTGTTVATGNQAKSILATVPQDWGLIASRIFDNFGRMWLEMITGFDSREGRGWYLPVLLGFFGLIAIPILFLKKNFRLVALMLLGWFLVMTAAVSTLDTAFWHFKRYQMPLLALLFPLGAWGIYWLTSRFPKVAYGYALILLIFSAALYAQFLNYYAVNVGYVYQQPYQMALWLRENTPETARIAVHDVGLMRYLGERETLDIVGLTTPEAAAYWRNGPGSVAEFLMRERPDYIASYGRGHGYGLAFLADTSLYANQLTSFTVENWQREINVALAADTQGIYQPDWNWIRWRGYSVQYPPADLSPSSPYGLYGRNFPIELVDVADLESERRYQYQWHNLEGQAGFLTEVRDMDLILGGYRLINKFEEWTFTLSDFYFSEDNAVLRNEPVILESRIHPQYTGTIDIYLNEQLLDTQWIPERSGHWFGIATYIPPDLLVEELNFRIDTNMNDGGYFMPASHALYIGINEATSTAPVRQGGLLCCEPENPLVIYQENAVQLGSLTQRIDAESLNLDFEWYSNGRAQGDYGLFVHLYSDINQAPLSQSDAYFLGMPLGNWLNGTIRDTISLNTSSLPNGTYSLAIGFYNPQNPQDRLMPESDVYEVSDDGRLWLGEVEISR